MRGEAAGKNKMKTSQKLLVDAHLRHSIGKLQDIGIEDLSSYDQHQIVSMLKPAEPSLVPPGGKGNRTLTLPHEILEVMPFDIV